VTAVATLGAVVARTHARGRRLVAFGFLAVVVVSFAALALGPLGASFDDPLVALRLPRVLLGIAVGAALGIAGAALQGLFRNPLADPGLIGVASGARLGATAFVVLGGGAWLGSAPWVPILALPLVALVGALGTLALVWWVAGRAPGTATLLLTGLALTLFEEAGVGLLSALADEQALRVATLWRLGGLGGATLDIALAVLGIVIVGALVLVRLARALDALSLGDDAAHTLGIEVRRTKRAVVIAAAAIVAGATAFAGVIGFVGLAVPHLVRLAAGPAGQGHRVIVPASALVGAALVVFADLLARTVAAPIELPLGVVTAFIGAPFLVFLVKRQVHAS